MTETWTLEQLLERDGYLVYKVRGVSMEPMLTQERDLVTIRRRQPGEVFAVNDVVLYYRAGDRLHTLHRIVDVLPDSYVILGDNCVRCEVGIPHDDVLGVLTSYTHKGQQVQLSSPAYQRYVARLPWRRRLLRAKAFLRRLLP